ncbi:MAG TPA: class I SAM-dependent methyltransferase [Chitinophagales bacterium]|nr:class I SAM-dependent methyltransferase [Chitinophagales bacterium]
MDFDKKKHWENIYENRPPEEVSWYQNTPTTSLEFVKKVKLPKSARIIDIGGGESFFVDYLLEQGYRNITVLDISDTAIRHARQRVGEQAGHVKWVVTDVVNFEPEEQYDFWHDRATFHFLTSEDDIEQYRKLVSESIKPKGHMMIGTFSDNGPQRCSGLEIHQYSESLMEEQFSGNFQKVECKRVDHVTPYNTIQNFLFCLFRRR